jgi:hypothetical protein
MCIKTSKTDQKELIIQKWYTIEVKEKERKKKYYCILPPSQIISHSKNLGELKHLTKIIEKITKIYDIKYIYYENITNEEPNDT